MESKADFREREGLILSQCRLESGLSQAGEAAVLAGNGEYNAREK